MRPPKTLRVGTFKFDVVMDPTLAEERAAGRMKFIAQEILLQPGQAPDYERDTVLHESIHAVIAAVGFTNWFPEDKEEELVRTLSPLILQLLRDNPRLVAYLTERT